MRWNARRSAVAVVAAIGALALLGARIWRPRRSAEPPHQIQGNIEVCKIDLPISALFALGYTRVHSVCVGRGIARLLRKPINVWTALAGIIIAAAWPLLLDGVLVFIWPPVALTSAVAIGWLTVFIVLTSCIFIAAWMNWRLAAATGPLFDNVLQRSPDRVRLIERWFRFRLQFMPQFIFSAGFSAVLLFALHSAARALSHAIQLGPVSYIEIAFAGYLGGNALYWLLTMAELPSRVYRCRDLKLVWHSPAATPLFIKWCSAYYFVATAVAVGVAGSEVIALLVPNQDESRALQTLSILIPVAGVLTALLAVVQPYLAISFIVRRAKLEALDELIKELPATAGSPRSIEERHALELYRQISDAPLLPINTSTVVQYVAALLGVLGAYLLPKFIH